MTFLETTGSIEEDIVILPPAQGDFYEIDVKDDDEDTSHRNVLVGNDALETLEVHKHKR